MTWARLMPVPEDKESLAIKFWWAYELLELNFIFYFIWDDYLHDFHFFFLSTIS